MKFSPIVLLSCLPALRAMPDRQDTRQLRHLEEAQETASTPFALLRGYHKTHTQHRMMCVEGLDIVECDPMPDGSDGPNIVYTKDGEKMVIWEEYSAVQSKNQSVTMKWSPMFPTDLSLKAAPTVNDDSDDATDTMWKFEDIVLENGVEYDRYIMRFDIAARMYAAAEDQRVLVETGLLPDRWEYLETRDDGVPYVVRQYSGRNEDAMYDETMFLMAERLTLEELKMDPEVLVIYLATLDHPIQQHETNSTNSTENYSVQQYETNNRTNSTRSLQLEAEGEFALVEFPPACMDNDDVSACARISRTSRLVAGAFESGYRFDAAFRDDKDRSAEFFGQFFVDQASGRLTFLQGSARGCATPKTVKVRKLAEVSVVLCGERDIVWSNNGVISGGIGGSAQVKAVVRNREVSVQLRGSIEVSVAVSNGRPQFAGITGTLGAEAEAAGVLALSADGIIELIPKDPRRLDVFNVVIRVRPAIQYSIGSLFRGSLSYTFRLVELGPLRLQKTDSLPPPRQELPPVLRFRETDFTNPTENYSLKEKAPFYWKQQTTIDGAKGPEAAVSGFIVRQSPSGWIVGVRTVVDRPDAPLFEKRIGGGGRRNIDSTRVDLEADEWVVSVSGYQYKNFIYQLTFSSNKGRIFDYAADRSFPNQVPEFGRRFDFAAAVGEAFYGIDAYVETCCFSYQRPGNTQSTIKDLKVLWQKAPEVDCQAESCLSRESAHLEVFPSSP